jgi:cytochrome c
MGCRNPFRISVDQTTGALFWGDIGPDARAGDSLRGPAGFDEINQARRAGNFGWPYFVADNKPYRLWDFDRQQPGGASNPAEPTNTSRYNTGPKNLPSAQAAMLWYPYAHSRQFQVGEGGRSAMAGPVYCYNPKKKLSGQFPREFNGSLFIYDWWRSWIIRVQLDKEGNPSKSIGGSLRMERICERLAFGRPIDMEFGPDGCLYILEYGNGWKENQDARLVRLEYQAR